MFIDVLMFLIGWHSCLIFFMLKKIVRKRSQEVYFMDDYLVKEIVEFIREYGISELLKEIAKIIEENP